MADTDLQGFILSMVGVAVVLTVGLIIMTQMQNNVGIQCSGGSLNDTKANCWGLECINTSGSYVVNSTYANCYNATNYGDVALLTSPINYTITQSVAYNATGAVQTNLSSIPNWIGIIITVALAFIVLGYFYNR